jgi:hypothetical protein
MLWVKAGNNIICPRCTDPRRADPDGPHRIREALVKDAETRQTTELEDSEAVRRAFGAFQYLLHRRRRRKCNDGDLIKAVEALVNGWKDGEGAAFAKQHGLDFGKLLGMGWTVGMIHRHIAKTWAQLVKIGFTPQSMVCMKNEQIDAVIGLYGMDVHLLRKEFGSISPGFTIRTLQDLRLDARIMRNLQIDAHEIACMGFDRNQLGTLHIQLHEWRSEMNLSLQHMVIWNIKGPSKIEHMETWTIQQLAALFGIAPSQFSTLRIVKDTVVYDDTDVPCENDDSPRRGRRGRNRRQRQRTSHTLGDAMRAATVSERKPAGKKSYGGKNPPYAGKNPPYGGKNPPHGGRGVPEMSPPPSDAARQMRSDAKPFYSRAPRYPAFPQPFLYPAPQPYYTRWRPNPYMRRSRADAAPGLPGRSITRPTFRTTVHEKAEPTESSQKEGEEVRGTTEEKAVETDRQNVETTSKEETPPEETGKDSPPPEETGKDSAPPEETGKEKLGANGVAIPGRAK